jgi:metallophosphoesterase (TIGR03767 family)
MGGRSRVLATALAAAALSAPPALGAPPTTVERTIQDRDDDNLLEYAPGEPHLVVGAEPGFRPPRNGSLLNFLQLSDFQMVDEESPGRVEPVDTTQRAPGLNPFSAAYRPQESLTTQVTEAMVRQVRNAVSPVTSQRAQLTILTGDNADSQQYNETRWFVDILDGTTGDPRQIDPDSGLHDAVGGCAPLPPGVTYEDNDSVYDGVRGGGRVGQDTGYYEPDGEEDGDGYTPDRERNQAEVPGPHADVTLRDFPGLLEAAQGRFEALGLEMPWYSAFGNHDALVQGNSPDAFLGPFGSSPETLNPTYDAVVRGCLKPSALPPGVDLEDFAGNPAAHLLESQPIVVPPDPRRCYLAKDVPNTALAPCDSGGWIQQHSRTTGLPLGHGFEPFAVGGQAGAGRPQSARANHDGYYSFSPRAGLRFVVLDTVTDECGSLFCSEGSVDDAQFDWADQEIRAAAAAGEYVLAFAHHTLRTTRFPSTDPSEQPIHYGERFDRMSNPPRPVRPDTPVETLEDLFCRSPNFLAYVNGHEHENFVHEHRCEDMGQGTNRFYEVSTAAHIDWPQQSRMIELVRNDDGTLSLVLTILDHDGPAHTGGGTAGLSVLRLASIARELAYNDYQGNRGARGEREDRNVIVKMNRPWPYAAP